MGNVRAVNWLSAMIAGEAVRSGETRAIELVGRQIGIGYWPTRRLIKGQAKTLDVTVQDRIRLAYLAWCDRQITALLDEIETARSADADLEDFETEIAALAEKIKAARLRAP